MCTCCIAWFSDKFHVLRICILVLLHLLCGLRCLHSWLFLCVTLDLCIQDTMISDYHIVESGPSGQRCQVVHWLRTFPFSFISQREYVIGRRVWKQDGALYGIMKSIKHPQAPPSSGIVRMDVFYSMWRSRTIPDPKDPSRPACETVLLHHEQFKIPERLSRFAVRHGMAGFVKKMAPAVKAFVAARRQRVDAVSCSL